jgi:hypothetical protein
MRAKWGLKSSPLRIKKPVKELFSEFQKLQHVATYIFWWRMFVDTKGTAYKGRPFQ